MSETESVRQLLAGLHAERVATWAPDALALNVNQRRILEETADRSGFVKPGDAIAPFSLPDVDGGTVDLEAALRNGPLVLLFFRFAGCPACNVAIPHYDRKLRPALEALGAELVAVSPQVPDRLKEIKARHALKLRVASDLDNALGRKLGILYTADAANQAAALVRGSFIGDVTGTGTWELPMPTVVVIGQDRVVTFADVAPDWMARTEAEPVIEAVRALATVAA